MEDFNSNEERRKYSRIESFWKVFKEERELGLLMDISEGGAHIWLSPDVQVNVGDTLSLYLESPEAVPPSQGRIYFSGEVRWLKKFKYDRRDIGISFLNVNEEQKDFVEEIIQYFMNENEVY